LCDKNCDNTNHKSGPQGAAQDFAFPNGVAYLQTKTSGVRDRDDMGVLLKQTCKAFMVIPSRWLGLSEVDTEIACYYDVNGYARLPEIRAIVYKIVKFSLGQQKDTVNDDLCSFEP
jgi:hypothetical protein